MSIAELWTGGLSICLAFAAANGEKLSFLEVEKIASVSNCAHSFGKCLHRAQRGQAVAAKQGRQESCQGMHRGNLKRRKEHAASRALEMAVKALPREPSSACIAFCNQECHWDISGSQGRGRKRFITHFHFKLWYPTDLNFYFKSYHILAFVSIKYIFTFTNLFGVHTFSDFLSKSLNKQNRRKWSKDLWHPNNAWIQTHAHLWKGTWCPTPVLMTI